MGWKLWDDLKAFTWYVFTEPFRQIKYHFKIAFYNSKKDVQNLRLWSDFCFALTLGAILLEKIDFIIMFLSLAVLFRVYFEWRSKKYRNAWKKRFGKVAKPEVKNDGA